jgi:hypothetical protein
MRPLLVVMAPPFLETLSGIGQGQKPRGVQALGSEPRVERFDERIVCGLSGAGEVNLHPMQIRPVFKQAAV